MKHTAKHSGKKQEEKSNGTKKRIETKLRTQFSASVKPGDVVVSSLNINGREWPHQSRIA